MFNEKRFSKDFTQVPNPSEIKLFNFTAEEFYIYYWLLSKPKNWKIIKNVIMSETPFREKAFNTAWSGLKSKGFIVHKKIKSAKGKFVDLQNEKGHFVHEYTFNHYPKSKIVTPEMDNQSFKKAPDPLHGGSVKGDPVRGGINNTELTNTDLRKTVYSKREFTDTVNQNLKNSKTEFTATESEISPVEEHKPENRFNVDLSSSSCLVESNPYPNNNYSTEGSKSVFKQKKTNQINNKMENNKTNDEETFPIEQYQMEEFNPTGECPPFPTPEELELIALNLPSTEMEIDFLEIEHKIKLSDKEAIRECFLSSTEISGLNFTDENFSKKYDHWYNWKVKNDPSQLEMRFRPSTLIKSFLTVTQISTNKFQLNSKSNFTAPVNNYKNATSRQKSENQISEKVYNHYTEFRRMFCNDFYCTVEKDEFIQTMYDLTLKYGRDIVRAAIARMKKENLGKLTSENLKSTFLEFIKVDQTAQG